MKTKSLLLIGAFLLGVSLTWFGILIGGFQGYFAGLLLGVSIIIFVSIFYVLLTDKGRKSKR